MRYRLNVTIIIERNKYFASIGRSIVWMAYRYIGSQSCNISNQTLLRRSQ
jgi:hypothetical protein